MRTNLNLAERIACIAVGALTMVGPAAAESIQPEQGFHLGLVLAQNPIGGDFDGSRILASKGAAGDIILVPRIENKPAVGIVAGFRKARSSWEFEYRSSQHDVSFMGLPGQADHESFALNWRHFFRSSSRVQPHLLAGWVPYAPITVHDASATATRVGDARFNAGWGSFQLGFGASILAHERVSLSAGFTRRFLKYTGAKGAAGVSNPIEEPLDGEGTEFVVGLGYTF